jgi:hypothetical protein
MHSLNQQPATDSANELRPILGDDATATFENDPNFIDSNPTESASSENVEEQRSTGESYSAAPKKPLDADDDEDDVDDEDEDLDDDDLEDDDEDDLDDEDAEDEDDEEYEDDEDEDSDDDEDEDEDDDEEEDE